MKFIFLTAATAKEGWSDQATEKYLDKIGHFVNVEKQQIKPNKNSRSQGEQKKQEDSEGFLDKIKDDDFVILFDERGKKLNSIEFSKKIEMVLNSGKKRCVFIIGGAFGVSENLKKRAQLVISFSDMVFNHLIAEVIMLEQVYRSFAILKNLPYHNV